METVKRKYEFIDYAFWFLLMLFSDAGGILKLIGGESSAGSLNMRDFLFVPLFGCFILISYKTKIKSKVYKKIVKHLFFFGLYYFIVFGFFVPTLKNTPDYTPFLFLKKSRNTLYSLLLFVMIYKFYIRSHIIFFKTFIIFSILILTTFLGGFFAGIDILPLERVDRRFINIDRIFLSSYGLLYLLIPMGTVIFVFKSNFKWKKLIIAAFSMMFVTVLLSLTRRDIIGVFLYLFIGIMLFNYFQHKSLIPVKKLLSVSFTAVIFGFIISLSFPKYLEASVVALEEAAYVIEHGETSSGRTDSRMGLGKDFMQNLITSNPLFGTGFDNRWRGTGDKEGYETSDYPFLAAIAMTGVFGILIFLPIYIVLVRMLVFDIKFLRKNKVDYKSFEFYIFILFITFFIYDLLQYMNWFLPVSLSRSFKWYAFLSLYLGSRHVFYDYINNEKKRLAKVNNI